MRVRSITKSRIEEARKLYDELERVRGQKAKLIADVDKLDRDYIQSENDLNAAEFLATGSTLEGNLSVRTPAHLKRLEEAQKRFAEIQQKREVPLRNWRNQVETVNNQLGNVIGPVMKECEQIIEDEKRKLRGKAFLRKRRQPSESL